MCIRATACDDCCYCAFFSEHSYCHAQNQSSLSQVPRLVPIARKRCCAMRSCSLCRSQVCLDSQRNNRLPDNTGAEWNSTGISAQIEQMKGYLGTPHVLHQGAMKVSETDPKMCSCHMPQSACHGTYTCSISSLRAPHVTFASCLYEVLPIRA